MSYLFFHPQINHIGHNFRIAFLFLYSTFFLSLFFSLSLPFPIFPSVLPFSPP